MFFIWKTRSSSVYSADAAGSVGVLQGERCIRMPCCLVLDFDLGFFGLFIPFLVFTCLICFVSQIPMTIVNSLLFSVIMYFMVGFNDTSSAFLFFLVTISISSIIGFFVAQSVAAIAPSIETGTSLFPISVFFSISFAGQKSILSFFLFMKVIFIIENWKL